MIDREDELNRTMVVLLDKYIDRAEGYLEEYLEQRSLDKAQRVLEVLVRFNFRYILHKHCS